MYCKIPEYAYSRKIAVIIQKFEQLSFTIYVQKLLTEWQTV